MRPSSTPAVARQSAAFSGLKKVDALNDLVAEDVPTWLSPDGCRLYMSSGRGGQFHTYVATKSK